MTEDNAASLTSEAAGKTTREIEQIVARIEPKSVPVDVVRTVTEALPSREVTTEVLTETLLRKHITVDSEYEQLLRAARDALSHAKPDVSELDVLKEGLRRIIKEAERRKGIVDKPRADRAAQGCEIPQSVKRAVWKRDGGRCQWRAADDQICGSSYQLEFHHKQDCARGDSGSAENVILLCRAHHRWATEMVWGRAAMGPFKASAPEERQARLDL
jgi:hypothetical protein